MRLRFIWNTLILFNIFQKLLSYLNISKNLSFSIIYNGVINSSLINILPFLWTFYLSSL